MENGLSPAFHLPAANGNMRRVFAYLIKQRHIAPAVITHFAHERTLYESRSFLVNRKGRSTTRCLWGRTGKEPRGMPTNGA